jgi:predicted component of type VI protein secretion system
VARLENEDGSLALRFQVSARLAAEKTEVPVSFDTRVDPAGRIRVRE